MNAASPHEPGRDTLLEQILRRVPGFRGYLQQEDRQESDQRTRQFVLQGLERMTSALDAYARQLVDQGRLDAMAEIERVRAHILQMDGKLRSALPVSAGFFALREVDLDLVEDLYDLDQTMMDSVDTLARQAGELGDRSASSTLAGISDQLLQLEATFDQRRTLMEQLRR